MKDEEIDRCLSVDGLIQPSSGFTRSVMEAVRREAATPPPIPFPWARAAPGLAAGGVALAALVLANARGASVSAPNPLPWLQAGQLVSAAAGSPDAAWILAASLLVLATVRVSWRLARSC